MSCFKPQIFCVKERATAIYSVDLLDQAGDPIADADLATLTLTLYPKKDPTSFINGRNDQDVLNANGVTVDGAGALVWEIAPDDNAIIGTAKEELHVALFKYSWNGGDRKWWHEVHLKVQNQTVIA